MHDLNKAGVANLGKTLKIVALPLSADKIRRNCMSALVAKFFSKFSAVFSKTGDVSRDDFVSSLIASADASAGNDPHHAYQLREAARSYLSVVR